MKKRKYTDKFALVIYLVTLHYVVQSILCIGKPMGPTSMLTITVMCATILVSCIMTMVNMGVFSPSSPSNKVVM